LAPKGLNAMLLLDVLSSFCVGYTENTTNHTVFQEHQEK